jgi:biotin operon repressor
MSRRARPPWLGDAPGFNFGQFSFQLLDDEQLSMSEIGVFMALVRHADIETGECYPAVETLAKYLRASKTTVRKAITTLEEAGYVAIERSAGRNVNHYWLLPPPPLNQPDCDQLDPNRPDCCTQPTNSGPVNRPDCDHELEPETRAKNNDNFENLSPEEWMTKMKQDVRQRER